jgi:hypothetical protein
MYSYKITLQKGAKYFIIFLLPFMVNQFIIQMPDVANLTIGAALVMILNYVKMNFDIK